MRKKKVTFTGHTGHVLDFPAESTRYYNQIQNSNLLHKRKRKHQYYNA